jgi:hypothetical protein
MADSDGRSSGPIALAIFGSAIVIALAVLINECGKRSFASREADAARILQVINTDPVQAGKNLNFLVNAEVIASKQQRDALAKVLRETRYGTGPALAAPNPSSTCPMPVDARGSLSADWLTISCIYWFPRNDGLVGTPKSTELAAGTTMDRYGGPTGFFLSPDTPGPVEYGKRSLPYEESKVPYYRYKVLKSFKVEAGPIAPWFGKPGGGVQYKTAKPIKDLVAEKVLEEELVVK